MNADAKKRSKARFSARFLRRLPAFGALVLLARRLRRSDRIRRVLVHPERVRAHYNLAGGGLVELAGAHVSAQPIAVVGPDRALLWAYSPQLKRRPTTADVLWRALPPARALAGRTLFAAVDGFSYYHWLTGTLPKLLFARKAGLRFAEVAQVIVNPRHKGRVNFQTETLALLGLDLNKIMFIDRGVHVACEALILPPEPTAREQTEVHAWALALLRDELLPPAGQEPSPGLPERLFVRRAAARRRRLVDEAALETELAALGFTAVTLEDRPWRDQVALFRAARVVVGLHGAGLSNLVFSAPGTRVVEIVPEVWRNPCFENLAARVGASYVSVAAKSVGARKGFAADACVDTGRLLAAVRAQLTS